MNTLQPDLLPSQNQNPVRENEQQPVFVRPQDGRRQALAGIKEISNEFPSTAGGRDGFSPRTAERRRPESMLNWTERIIRMRKEVPEIGWGRFHRPNLRVGATISTQHQQQWTGVGVPIVMVFHIPELAKASSKARSTFRRI